MAKSFSFHNIKLKTNVSWAPTKNKHIYQYYWMWQRHFRSNCIVNSCDGSNRYIQNSVGQQRTLLIVVVVCVKQCVHLFRLQWHSCSSASLTFSQWQAHSQSLMTVGTNTYTQYLYAHTLKHKHTNPLKSCFLVLSVNTKHCTVIDTFTHRLRSLWIPNSSFCLLFWKMFCKIQLNQKSGAIFTKHLKAKSSSNNLPIYGNILTIMGVSVLNLEVIFLDSEILH